MDLKKLSPSLLVALGLACNRTPPTVHPCLSQPYDPGDGGDVGPCLSPPADPTDPTDPGGEPGEPTQPDEPPVGPCLEPPVGPCLSPPAPGIASASPEPTTADAPSLVASTRRDALERVLARAALPPDVAARLRRHTEHE